MKSLFDILVSLLFVLADLCVAGFVYDLPATKTKNDLLLLKRSKSKYPKMILDPAFAWQSSTWRIHTADKALTSYCEEENWKFSSGTEKEINPMWAIDLRISYFIKKIAVTGSTGNSVIEFREIHIYILDTKPILSPDFHLSQNSSYYKGPPAKDLENVVFECNKIGRYVAIVSRVDLGALKLCHISFYGALPDPVDGAWSEWSESSCSQSCDGGRKTKTRSCTNPAPQNYGIPCLGKSKISIVCNVDACLVSALSTKNERFTAVIIGTTCLGLICGFIGVYAIVIRRKKAAKNDKMNSSIHPNLINE